MKNLILIDLDNLLFRRYDLSEERNYSKFSFQHKNKMYDPIKGCRKFVNQCSQYGDIMIYTSMTKYNAEVVSKRVLGKKIYNSKIKFVLSREYNQWDPMFNRIEGIKSHDTVKLIDLIIQNPSINRDRQYTEERTILIDDTYRKIRYNDPRNIILFRPLESSQSKIYGHDEKSIEEVIELTKRIESEDEKAHAFEEFTPCYSYSDILDQLFTRLD